MTTMHDRQWQSPPESRYGVSSGGGSDHLNKNGSGEDVYGQRQISTARGGHHHNQLHPPRGSLGQFIERSTSAPPPSSAAFFGSASENSDSLVGNDLLQYVTVGYGDSPLKSNSGTQVSNHADKGKLFEHNNVDGDDEEEEGFGVVWLQTAGDNNETESSDFMSRGSTNGVGVMSTTTIGSFGSSLSRPVSASGDGLLGMDGRRSHLYGDLQLDFGSGLFRSQSAAPSSSGRSSLGPPPGLSEFNDDSYSSSSSSRQHSSNQWGQGIRRPSSAGGGAVSSLSVGATSGTLRPSAKTLMDLIQEDSAPDDHRLTNQIHKIQMHEQHSGHIGGNVNPQTGVGINISSPGMNHMSKRLDSTSQTQRTSPCSGVYVNSAAPQYHEKYPTLPHPVVAQRQHQEKYETIADHPVQMGYQQQIIQQPDVGLQDESLLLFHQRNAQTIPNHHQSIAISNVAGSHRLSAYDDNPSPVYTQGFQPQTHQQPQPSHQQHILFNGHRIDISQALQTQSMPNQGLHTDLGIQSQSMSGVQVHGMPRTQTIQLPNGQTIYVSTSPTPPQQYGYSNAQYHVPQNQHAHVVQQSIHHGHSNDNVQYLSVVPVQSGPQMTYWQTNNGVPAQQTVIGMTNTACVANPVGISKGHSGSSDVSATLQHMHHQPMNNGLYATTGGGGGGVKTPREKAGRGRKAGNSNRRGAEVKTAAAPVSSPLLEEFRASKNRDWTMRKIEGHVIEFCQDQNGSRFIQQRLEMGDVTEQQIVMQEVLPAIRRLRNDVFGNYVVQKLLDFGTKKMKADIQSTLEGEMVQLSLQMYGCRVVQKALEALSEDDLPRLLREFHHNVLSCIHDQNGNHVIQKCIEVLNAKSNKASQMGEVQRATFLAEQIDFIVEDILINTTSLSCHPYGCRVLQRILEHCPDSKKAGILDEIKNCHEKLLDDQYGNYVIQHVLQFGRDTDRDSILQIVVKNGLLCLSRQKFASNVVEKLLKYGNSHHRCSVVREMLKAADDPATPSDPSDGSTSVVLLMVRDAYANYVVQTTLDVVPESDEKQKLLEELNGHAEELRNYTFAKHIVAKLASLNGES